MEPLTTFEVLGDHLQQNLDDAQGPAELALTSASAVIRRHCRQTLSLVEDDEVNLQGTWDMLLALPQRPVLEVTAVAGPIAAPAVSLPLVGPFPIQGDAIWRRYGWFGPQQHVTVTYTHGFVKIPDEIVAVCLNLAARVLDNPLSKQSESYTGHSVSRLFPLELSRTEKEILNAFRRTTK